MKIDNVTPFERGSISIYIHWAFCLKKCPYCDFNSYVSNNVNQKAWRDAYFKAFELQKPFFINKKIKSIFFGGGTPSLMDPSTIHDIIAYFTKHNGGDIAEITLESNPSTFEIGKFKDFKQAGVNRLSTGIQSFVDDNLRFLGRNHNRNEAIVALEKSNEIFERTSFDLIMGLPNQSFEELKLEVAMALNFFKEHLSIYQLTIEEGTAFYRQKVKELEDDISSIFYEYIVDTLEGHNIKAYEISNFAIEGGESIHNLNYWKGGEYLGFGANAQGRIYHNNQWIGSREIKDPKGWLGGASGSKEVGSCKNLSLLGLGDNPLWEEFEIISNVDRFVEVVMTSLRINEPLPEFLVKNLDNNKVTELVLENLFVWNKSGQLIATKKGRMCLNYVLQRLF